MPAKSARPSWSVSGGIGRTNFIDLHLDSNLPPLKSGQFARSLEMMAGVANFSTSMTVFAFWQALALDTLYDQTGHDLSNVFLQERILKMVSAGVFACIHIGLVCTSWTRLANPPYRSSDEINGLRSLCKDKADWVKGQNALHSFSMKVIHAAKTSSVTIKCRRHKVLCSLENGDTTMLWEHPSTKKECTEEEGVFHRTAMCAWGVPWRKTTKIWATRKIDNIEKSCRCKVNHPESIKGSIRIKVRGKGKVWMARSQVSAAYPTRLCNQWAASVNKMFQG